MLKDGLPIVFGITGHRDLVEADAPALKATVRSIFQRFRDAYAATPFVLITPLAVGADRLVADVALSFDIPLRVLVPLELPEYRKDFDAAENADFDRILAAANLTEPDVEFVGFVAGNSAADMSDPARRAVQYQRVGEQIARVAHVLIALWNGKASDSVGGTAKIVDFRLFGTPGIPDEPSDYLNLPATGAVYHVCSARRSDAAVDCPSGTLVIKTRFGDVKEEADPCGPLYARIDRFNRDRERHLGISHATSSGEGLRRAAELLANRYQRYYQRALDAIFLSATLAAISLAMGHRDEPQYVLAGWYCLLVGISYAIYRTAMRGEWKDRSIEYRALEFGLRIQQLWDLAGVRASAADCYLRIQRGECDWIRQAVQTMHQLGPPSAPDPARGVVAVRDFIVEQKKYFEWKSEKLARQDDRLGLISGAFVTLGAILTVLLAVLALWHIRPGESSLASTTGLGAFWTFGDPLIRAIIIATILAAATAEYGRRRAFRAESRRYAAMLPIYARALELHDAAREDFSRSESVSRQLVEQIGREALTENSEWLLMHRDLPVGPLHV